MVWWGHRQLSPTQYLATLTLIGALAAKHNDWRQRFTFGKTLPLGDGVGPIRGKGGPGFDFNSLQTLCGLIDAMSDIVAQLVESGATDTWIQKHIGMGKDELLRHKQLTGLASLFKDREFSEAWDTWTDKA